ncbi:terminase small subunit [Thiotrichales bacterium 19X7-9]|nr:terminase small subunit [Thiotrichales bacterium 19X7-9]
MPTIVKGKVATKQQASDIFGVYVTTIDDWVRRGCPYLEKGGRGRAWSFNTADLFKWRLQEEVNQNEKIMPNGEQLNLKIKQAKLRLTDAQADNEKIKARLAANKVIDADLLSSVLADVFGLMRNKLLSIPERVESRLVGETDKDKFRKVLLDELKEAMFDISDNSSQTISKILSQGQNND